MRSHSRTFSILTLAVTLACATFSARAETLEVHQGGLLLTADAWNNVQVRNADGKTLITFNGFHVKWNPKQSTVGGTFKEISDSSGQKGLEVSYQTKSEDDVAPITIVGRFILHAGRVDVEYDLANVPDAKATSLGGSMFGRVLPRDAKELDSVRLGLWERHSGGGAPYEIPDGTLIRYQAGDTQIAFAYGADIRPQIGWKDAGSQHVVLKKITPDHFAGNFSVIFAPANWSVSALAAQWHGRPVSLNLGTDKTYNLWSDAKDPLTIKQEIVNTSTDSREIEVAHWVRNFSGDIVSSEKKKITLKPGDSYREPIQINTKTPRDILFAEASAKDLQTGREVFSRTNLALLPPHQFKSTTDDSIFGISAYWPIPSENDVQNLMDRMGVRWVRHGDTRIQHSGRIANHHSNINWNKEWTEDERTNWIKKQLALCVENKVYGWEFANEINMSTAGIAQEGTGIGKAALAEKYVDWIKAIRKIQKETGTEQIKLLSFGVAGMDVKFWKRLYELGGWPHLDGMCLHPGRGNFTADYPVSEPWQNWVVGPEGNYWNYYGSVKTAQELIRQNGGNKSLWLTEIYTCTYPNNFWEDTPRNAAENAVMQFALAKAENVKAVFWYQMFDSVWWDRLGVNPKDREYYFGLLNRDLSFKPVLMGYIAAAEALDQATFNRWLKWGDTHNRGLLFDTPRGAMAILWNRTDGYTLTKKSANFATPEPWIDTWKSHITTEIPATGDQITVINAVGQSKTLAVKNGKATIELTGAPLIVYGMDASRLTSGRP